MCHSPDPHFFSPNSLFSQAASESSAWQQQQQQQQEASRIDSDSEHQAYLGRRVETLTGACVAAQKERAALQQILDAKVRWESVWGSEGNRVWRRKESLREFVVAPGLPGKEGGDTDRGVCGSSKGACSPAADSGRKGRGAMCGEVRGGWAMHGKGRGRGTDSSVRGGSQNSMPMVAPTLTPAPFLASRLPFPAPPLRPRCRMSIAWWRTRSLLNPHVLASSAFFSRHPSPLSPSPLSPP